MYNELSNNLERYMNHVIRQLKERKSVRVFTERRSIYRDIHEINKALLATNEGISLEQADELLSEDEEYKIIRHHK